MQSSCVSRRPGVQSSRRGWRARLSTASSGRMILLLGVGREGGCRAPLVIPRRAGLSWRDVGREWGCRGGCGAPLVVPFAIPRRAVRLVGWGGRGAEEVVG